MISQALLGEAISTEKTHTEHTLLVCSSGKSSMDAFSTSIVALYSCPDVDWYETNTIMQLLQGHTPGCSHAAGICSLGSGLKQSGSYPGDCRAAAVMTAFFLWQLGALHCKPTVLLAESHGLIISTLLVRWALPRMLPSTSIFGSGVLMAVTVACESCCHEEGIELHHARFR